MINFSSDSSRLNLSARQWLQFDASDLYSSSYDDGMLH